MARRANPTLIGAFVVGAVALAVAGVLAFGSGRLFTQTATYVSYFPGSVNGLNIGAPVKYRGVQVGEVTDIRVVIRQAADGEKPSIPVTFELDASRISVDGAPFTPRKGALMQELIDRGLRAQLQAESLVTGLLFIQLDFFPDTPATRKAPPESKYPEIPTVPTVIEQAASAAREIINELRQINFGPVLNEAAQALKGINELVNSPAVKQAVDGLPGTIQNLNQAIASVRSLLDNVDARVGPIATRIEGTMTDAQGALDRLEGTFSNAQALIEPGAPLEHDLRKALRDVSDAARSIQLLADYLERNPSSLLYGRITAEGEP